MYRTMRGIVVASLFAGCAAPAARADAPDAASFACPAPAEFVTPDNRLDRVAEAVRAGRLDILALGSATTVGRDASGRDAPAGSFPYRMAERLRAAWPGVTVRLTVRGGRGYTAEAMLPLLQQALSAEGGRPALVLWQTGTVEAVRGLRPDDLHDALEEGAERVRAAGADLVLIDPQFSRFLRANADLDPYEHVLQQYATLPDVALFRRFDLMRGWAADGGLDLERAPEPERAHAMQALQDCIGAALAQYVVNGAAPSP